jgi:two-component system, chemotaxis family, chemotaxis protein CheY
MTRRFDRYVSLRVLIVDDLPFARQLIRTMLQQMGILKIVEASSGQDALNHLSENPVDLLMCDWHMPGMSGLEVLIEVRQQACYAALPVLMVTAELTAAQVRDAIRAGVTSYVAKPFKPAVLKAHIESCLALPGRAGHERSADARHGVRGHPTNPGG